MAEFNEFPAIIKGDEWSIIFGFSDSDGTAKVVTDLTFSHHLKYAGVVIAHTDGDGANGTVVVSGSTTTSTVLLPSGQTKTYTYYPITITYPADTTADLPAVVVDYGIHDGTKTIYYGTQDIIEVP